MSKITQEMINEVREDHIKVCKASRDRIAVIVQTYISKQKFSLGVQFWTDTMIACGASQNTDKTISTFICAL